MAAILALGCLPAKNNLYLAGDFSGFQRNVLGVKNAGKAQAKRLRARSFLLGLFEHTALWTITKRLRLTDDDNILRGGCGSLVRIPPDADSICLEELHSDLQRKVWNESGGDGNSRWAGVRRHTPQAVVWNSRSVAWEPACCNVTGLESGELDPTSD